MILRTESSELKIIEINPTPKPMKLSIIDRNEQINKTIVFGVEIWNINTNPHQTWTLNEECTQIVYGGQQNSSEKNAHFFIRDWISFIGILEKIICL